MSLQPVHEAWDSAAWHPANPLHATEQIGNSSLNDHIASEGDMIRRGTLSKEPTKNDWDRLRPEIERLYTKLELKEVMAIINHKYNLRASEKMYKDRRRAWGINKHIKSNEIDAIVRKRAQRLQEGKNSHFQLRSTWVPESKIERYRRDKKIQSEQQAMGLRAGTPPGLICYTPLASPLTTPRELEVPERLARIVHDYIASSFDSGLWLVGREGFCQKASVTNKMNAEPSLSNDFFNGMNNAAQLFTVGRTKMAWQSLQISINLIGKVVSAEAPQTVNHLVDTVLVLIVIYELPDIAIAVLSQFYNMSTKFMGKLHPLSQLSGFVKELAATQDVEALVMLGQVNSDDFTQRVGRLSCDAVEFQLDQIYWSSKLKGTPNSLEALQALLKSCENVDSASEECRVVRQQLASQLLDVGRFQEAIEVCERAANLASDECSTARLAFNISEALHIMSHCQMHLGDFALADQSMRRAIDIRGAHYGFQDESVLWLMIRYGWLLEEADRLDEAVQVYEYHDRLVASKHEKILREEEEEWQRYQALQGGE